MTALAAYLAYAGIFLLGVGFGVAAIAWLELWQIDRQRRRRERDLG